MESMNNASNNRWNHGANDNVQRATASAVIDKALAQKIPCHKWGSKDNVIRCWTDSRTVMMKVQGGAKRPISSQSSKSGFRGFSVL